MTVQEFCLMGLLVLSLLHLCIFFTQTYETLQSLSQFGMGGPLFQRVHTQFQLLHSQVQGCKVSEQHYHIPLTYISLCLSPPLPLSPDTRWTSSATGAVPYILCHHSSVASMASYTGITWSNCRVTWPHNTLPSTQEGAHLPSLPPSFLFLPLPSFLNCPLTTSYNNLLCVCNIGTS